MNNLFLCIFKMETLLCPECQEGEQKSFCRISPLKHYSHDLADADHEHEDEKEEYWDETGKHHNHSSFKKRHLVECSKNHVFIFVRYITYRCHACDTKSFTTNYSITISENGYRTLKRNTHDTVLSERREWNTRHSQNNIKKAVSS